VALALLKPPLHGGTAVNWFNLSFLGWVILIVALAIAAYMMHAPPVWIGIGALALLGVGIIVSVSKSKPQI
jgi:membrane protein YdbS with pleckstrin-like domain